jgi:CBS domain-containing protein
MTAEKHILDQTVGDVMDTVVSVPASVRSDGTLREVLDAMLDEPITRKVYVVDEGGVLLGTVTVETLLRQAGYRLGVRATGMMSYFRFLKEVFTEELVEFYENPMTVTLETTLVDATKLMVEYKLNDLPVIDEAGVLIGELNSYEILMKGRSLFDGDEGQEEE